MAEEDEFRDSEKAREMGGIRMIIVDKVNYVTFVYPCGTVSVSSLGSF